MTNCRWAGSTKPG